MHSRADRRHFVLFVAAVLLPCALLVFLGVRLIQQEIELDEKRQAEVRMRMATEVGQELLVRLEQLKLRVSRLTPETDRNGATVGHHSAQVVVLRETAAGLIPPWNTTQEAASVALRDASFLRRVWEGERLEFAAGRPDRAASLYSVLLSRERDPSRAAYIRLLSARALSNAGDETGALRRYRELLELPFELQDEHGIPFSLYAARQLLSAPAHLRFVLDRLQTEMAALRWLSPQAAYMLLESVEKIVELTESQKDQRRVAKLLEAARSHVHLAQVLSDLVRDYPAIALRFREASSTRSSGGKWIPYGEEPFLIGRLAEPDASGLVLVVRPEEVLSDVLSQLGGDVRRVRLAAAGAGAFALSDRLPGLALVGWNPPADEVGSRWGVQHTMYSILVLVLGLILFSGYMLLRDTRREIRLAELRSQFVASVSHELKTPLTSIRMFAETLRMGRWRDRQRGERYLDTIVNESERLSRLINNVLDFSRIERGAKAFRPKPTCLHDVVRSAADAMAYSFEQQGIVLELTGDEQLPPILADRDAIEQAIINLLANAVKYSGNGRKIEVHLSRRDGRAGVAVKDHGIGVPPEEQQRIFEKFYRGRGADQVGVPGTGLGLPLVAHIASVHGGQVSVESTPGAGSTFTLELPLEEP